jgi:hypothetical protein
MRERRCVAAGREISPWTMFVVSEGGIPNRRRRTQAYLALAHAVLEAGLRSRLDLAIESPFYKCPTSM